MMNSSSSHPCSDPYVLLTSSSMIVSTIAANDHHQQLLDYSWGDAAPQHLQTPPAAPYNFDPPVPFLLPTNMNMNTTSPFAADHQYPTAAGGESTILMKREEIGLNLGHRTYFSSADALTIDRLLIARAHQPPRCQVDGCKADLSAAKHYHRRHKVCEFHSKATVVLANGNHQRFCQQCSRFHVLGEFDESKRSCRKRLADHNRRRRKPQNPNSTNSTAAAHTTRPSTSILNGEAVISRSTATIITSAMPTDNSTGFQGAGQAGNDALLSLGGVDHQLHQSQLYQQYQHLSSSTTTSNNNDNCSSSSFYHQGLFGSSSNEASAQSTAEGGAPLAMFEVDFM